MYAGTIALDNLPADMLGEILVHLTYPRIAPLVSTRAVCKQFKGLVDANFKIIRECLYVFPATYLRMTPAPTVNIKSMATLSDGRIVCTDGKNLCTLNSAGDNETVFKRIAHLSPTDTSYIQSLVIDNNDNVYILQSKQIKKVNLVSKTVEVLSKDLEFFMFSSFALDHRGNFILCEGKHIQTLSKAGDLKSIGHASTTWRKVLDGPIEEATFWRPVFVAVHPKNTDIYIIDSLSYLEINSSDVCDYIRVVSNGYVRTIYKHNEIIHGIAFGDKGDFYFGTQTGIYKVYLGGKTKGTHIVKLRTRPKMRGVHTMCHRGGSLVIAKQIFTTDLEKREGLYSLRLTQEV
mmetsp:Transcript_16566/g.18422  ORF Transcript_16566/g.18422 Transcript_16566/m.18422 type:complete len:347 (+) Transcript_16566:166-1206(+)